MFSLQKSIDKTIRIKYYLKNIDTNCKKTKPENDLYKSVLCNASGWASKTTGYSGYYSRVWQLLFWL
jgi:hypothetical protein